MELSGQTRELSITFGVWSVTGGALRNPCLGHSFLKDLLSGSDQLFGSASKGLGVKTSKMFGKTRYQSWTERMRNAKHESVLAPMFDKSPQLVLKIFGLLPCQARHRRRPTKTLPGQSVTGLAILYLGLQVPPGRIFGRSTYSCKNQHQDRNRHCQVHTCDLHVLAPAHRLDHHNLSQTTTSSTSRIVLSNTKPA
jgi:hypothetical protein